MSMKFKEWLRENEGNLQEGPMDLAKGFSDIIAGAFKSPAIQGALTQAAAAGAAKAAGSAPPPVTATSTVQSGLTPTKPGELSPAAKKQLDDAQKGLIAKVQDSFKKLPGEVAGYLKSWAQKKPTAPTAPTAIKPATQAPVAPTK